MEPMAAPGPSPPTTSPLTRVFERHFASSNPNSKVPKTFVSLAKAYREELTTVDSMNRVLQMDPERATLRDDPAWRDFAAAESLLASELNRSLNVLLNESSKNEEKLEAENEIDALLELALAYVSRDRAPLPTYMRYANVVDSKDFLTSELIVDKSMMERFRFLSKKNVAMNEVAEALRIVSQAADHGLLPYGVADIKRGFRLLREDQVENSMNFFLAQVVAEKSMTDKIAFLVENKRVTYDEIDEALDRSQPQLVERGAALLRSKQFANEEARANALIKLGLSKESIGEVLKLVPFTTSPPAKVEDDATLVERARRVLLDPAVASKTPEEKRAFLLSKGMSLDQIQRAESLAASSATLVAPKPPQASPAVSMDNVAYRFLSDPKTASKSVEERVAFLVAKGVPQATIDAALKELNLTVTATSDAAPSKETPAPPETNKEEALAMRFLTSTAAGSKTLEERVAFLRSKGVDQAAIDKALEKLKSSPPKPAGEDPNGPNASVKVAQAARFLTSPKASLTPIEDRVAFLRKKDLTEEEIADACELAGIDTGAAFLAAMEKLSAEVGESLRASGTRAQLVEELMRATTSSSSPPIDRISALRAASRHISKRARGSGLKPNPTSAGLRPRPVAAKPSMPPPVNAPTLIAITLNRLIFLKHDSQRMQRIRLEAGFVLAASIATPRVRRGARDNRLYVTLLEGVAFCCTKCTKGLYNYNLDDPKEFQLREAEANLAALVLEFAAVSNTQRFLEVSLAMYDKNRQTAQSIEYDEMGDDAGFECSRAIHGHYASRASCEAFEGATRMLLNLCGLDKPPASSDPRSIEGWYVPAAMIRAGADFGWGLLPPKDWVETDAVRTEFQRRVSSRPTASKGLAALYSQVYVRETCPALLGALFRGSLYRCSHPDNDVDVLALQARIATKISAFRLAATLAQAVLTSAGSSEPARRVVLEAAGAFADDCYIACRRATSVRRIIAKRVIERAYDAERSQRLTLQQDLGSHADASRLFQTAFLVSVVVLDGCQPASVEVCVLAWRSLAKLGFALVPVPDAVKLQRKLESLVAIDFAMSKRSSPSWSELSSLLLADVVPDDRSSADDYVLGSRIEYTLDTGASALFEEADRGSSADSASLNDFWATATPNLSKTLLDAIMLGAGHAFVPLHQRIASRYVAGVSHAAGLEPAATSTDDEQLGSLCAVLDGLPDYIQTVVASRHVPMGTIGYLVGSVTTSLNSSLAVAAQPLASVVFARIVDNAREWIFEKESVDPDDEPSADGKPEHQRAQSLLAVTCATLKAIGLPSLPLALDETEALLREIRYELHVKHDPRSVLRPACRLTWKETVDVLFGFASRIDDAPRRTILIAWYLTRVKTLGLQHYDEDEEAALDAAGETAAEAVPEPRASL